jgi:rare lipoprotein A
MSQINKFIYILLLISTSIFSEPARQEGKASYYADSLAGKKTASGEVYSPNKYTAAHKTHPFNTLLKVTNKKNSKFVIVRVNDKGPHNEKRIIDLSRKAAETIDIIKAGEAVVTIEVIGKGEAGVDPSQTLEPTKDSSDSSKDKKSTTSPPLSSKKQIPPASDSKSTPTEEEEEFDPTDEDEDDEEAVESKKNTKDSKTSKYTDLEGNPIFPKGTGIQIGAFQEEELAKSHGIKAQEIGFPSIALEKTIINDSTYYRVIVYNYLKGKESSQENKKVFEKLKKEGFGIHFLYKFKE